MHDRLTNGSIDGAKQNRSLCRCWHLTRVTHYQWTCTVKITAETLLVGWQVLLLPVLQVLPLPLLLLLQPFNGLFSKTTWVSRNQEGKTNLDFTGARDSEWQWHQLGHMQVCTSLQTDNHANTHHSVFYRPDALPATQPTASKHWRHDSLLYTISHWQKWPRN